MPVNFFEGLELVDRKVALLVVAADIHDSFDFFIKNEIKLFSFFIEAYYKNNKSDNLKLKSIADANILIHFDQMILRYLQNKTIDNYHHIREMYIFMLENKLLEFIRKENIVIDK